MMVAAPPLMNEIEYSPQPMSIPASTTDTIFYGIRHFNSPPNNSDVYTTVQSSLPDEPIDFFDVTVREAGARKTRFTAGMVREQTWIYVIRESPQKFVPKRQE
jgi:hypothetical protein